MENQNQEIIAKLKAAAPGKKVEILREYLTGLIRDVLHKKKNEPVDVEGTFADLGMDSITAVQLARIFNDQLAEYVSILSTDIFDQVSINRLSAFISSKLDGEGSEVKETKKEDSSTKNAKDFLEEMDKFLDDNKS